MFQHSHVHDDSIKRVDKGCVGSVSLFPGKHECPQEEARSDTQPPSMEGIPALTWEFQNVKLQEL